MKTTTTDGLAGEQGQIPLVLAQQGEGLAYQPWLTVREVRSQGRKTRAAGHTVSRKHDLFSDLETHFFLLADYAQDVIDIREQFPLLPIDLSIQIAQEMGVRHPRNRKTGKLVVMTTDFVLTRLDKAGRRRYHAYSVKPSSRLTENSRRRKRTLEKLEIERRLWHSFNVPWTLVTEQVFNTTVIDNLQWLSYGARGIRPELQAQLPYFLERLLSLAHSNQPLKYLFATLADLLKLEEEGDAQQLFCHAVWTHRLHLDLSQPIALLHPIRFPLAAQQNTVRNASLQNNGVSS